MYVCMHTPDGPVCMCLCACACVLVCVHMWGWAVVLWEVGVGQRELIVIEMLPS